MSAPSPNQTRMTTENWLCFVVPLSTLYLEKPKGAQAILQIKKLSSREERDLGKVPQLLLGTAVRFQVHTFSWSSFSASDTERHLSSPSACPTPACPAPCTYLVPGVRHSQPREFPMGAEPGSAQAPFLPLLLPSPVPPAWVPSPRASTGLSSGQPPGPQSLGCPHPACCP